VAHGNPIFGFHEIGKDFGVHGVMPPGLLDVVVRTVRNILPDLAPHPAKMNARVPNPKLVRMLTAKLISW
jgi:hypothetical protein